jgi:nitroreductase
MDPSSADPEGFFSIVGRQRACRHFLPDPVPDATLLDVLTAATKAPSSENGQPWVFVLVTEDAPRERLGRIMQEIWASGEDTARRAAMDPVMRADVASGIAGNVVRAPVLVVVGADTERVPRQWMPGSIWPSVQNLLVAAYAAGMASALTTIATGRAEDVRDVVGFPEHVDPIAVVPLGYPQRPLKPPRREPAEAHTHAGRYGTPWLPILD